MHMCSLTLAPFAALLPATAILDYKVVGLPADNPVGDTTTGRVEITAAGEVQGSGVVSGQQRLGAGCSCVSRAPACTTKQTLMRHGGAAGAKRVS